MDTCLACVGMSLVMTVPMKDHQVSDDIVAVIAIHVVDFHQVSFLEEQSAPLASPLLPLQESGEPFSEHWMLFEPLAPVQ